MISKFKSTLILFFIIIYSCKTNGDKESKVISSVTIDSLVQEAIKTYNDFPEKSKSLFSEVSMLSRKNKDYKKSGIANLNIAGIEEEIFKNNSEALKYSLESLSDWVMINDSMQIANLKKYIGLLKGYVGSYEEGIQSIEEAIKIYGQKGFTQGIAVSEINMAKIYLLRGDHAKSLEKYNSSKSFWSSQKEQSRIFDNNLVGMEIYKNLNDLKSYTKLIQENNSIMDSIKINDYLVDKFEKLQSSH